MWLPLNTESYERYSIENDKNTTVYDPVSSRVINHPGYGNHVISSEFVFRLSRLCIFWLLSSTLEHLQRGTVASGNGQGGYQNVRTLSQCDDPGCYEGYSFSFPHHEDIKWRVLWKSLLPKVCSEHESGKKYWVLITFTTTLVNAILLDAVLFFPLGWLFSLINSIIVENSVPQILGLCQRFDEPITIIRFVDFFFGSHKKIFIFKLPCFAYCILFLLFVLCIWIKL
jgi:hypothetical protein